MPIDIGDYRIVAGTYYHIETPRQVIDVLESARHSKQRLRLHYGDQETGRDWLEEHDVVGYIGRSTGPIKVPLMIHNRRSLGGPALLDRCIIKIRSTGKHGGVLYQHPNYHTETFTFESCRLALPDGRVLTCAVLVNGQEHARFETEAMARRWVARMTGLSVERTS